MRENGSVLISGAKAFNRKGREGFAKVAKKSTIEIRTLPRDWQIDA